MIVLNPSKPINKNIKYNYQNSIKRIFLFYNDNSNNTVFFNILDYYCNFYDLDNNLLNKIILFFNL